MTRFPYFAARQHTPTDDRGVSTTSGRGASALLSSDDMDPII